MDINQLKRKLNAHKYTREMMNDMKLKIGKKSGLKYFGYEDIKSWNPCYDPIKHISKDWRGTAIDILKNNKINLPLHRQEV